MKQLFSPSHLKHLCQTYNLTPSKKYGQNYLVSDAPIKKMIEAGELHADDTIVEIGPGFGVLTLSMAPHVKKIVAFEIEKKLQPYWEEMQEEYPNIEVVWGNALKEMQNSKFQIQNKKYKVLANLPYQITSNVLRTLLELEHKPERIIVMVQKEVAERIVAKPGDMSLLALSVQYYGTPNIVTKVTKGNFWPSPKVDSAVIAITNLQDPPLRQTRGKQDAEAFFRYARAGFANKRKQLWKNISVGLGLDGEVVKAALQQIVGNEKVRAEELSVEEWEDVLRLL